MCSAHLLEAAALAGLGSSPPSWQCCIDLGCGTGLMGPLLRPYVGRLEGVDLSAGMVQKAKDRGCYDKLDVGELVACLNGRDKGEARGELIGAM
jgi:predicted TPR repeat methyltransferase